MSQSEIIDEELFTFWDKSATDEEVVICIRLLLKHFNLELWKTNKTKHGNIEYELRRFGELI